MADREVPNTLVLARPGAPYLSLGFHQSFPEEIDPSFLVRRPVPWIRRIEGGGATYLDPDQWFYQLVYVDEDGGPGGPSDLQRFLQAPARATRELGLPTELRSPSDLVVGGRKFSGNAGGDWDGAHVLVGGYLLRADTRSMSEMLALPHPALRPLLRREIERWVTSWEKEVGVVPSQEELRSALLEAFAREGLFRVRAGSPSPREEARFRTETVPRHEDPAWRELKPLPKRPGDPLRRIRVAGPHGLLVLPCRSGEGLWAAVLEADQLQEGYHLDPGGDGVLRPVREGSAESSELRQAVGALPPFG